MGPAFLFCPEVIARWHKSPCAHAGTQAALS